MEISTGRSRGRSQNSSRRTVSAMEATRASSSEQSRCVAMCRASWSKRSRWVSQESASARPMPRRTRRAEARRVGGPAGRCRPSPAAGPRRPRTRPRPRRRGRPAGRGSGQVPVPAGRSGSNGSRRGAAARAPRAHRSAPAAEIVERPPCAVDGDFGGNRGNPVEAIVPVIPVEPAVGLEQAGRDAGAFGGAPQRLRLGRFRIAVHDQRVMVRFGELRRLAPVVDMGEARAPGTQDRRRSRDIDAGIPRLLPVVEGGCGPRSAAMAR